MAEWSSGYEHCCAVFCYRSIDPCVPIKYLVGEVCSISLVPLAITLCIIAILPIPLVRSNNGVVRPKDWAVLVQDFTIQNREYANLLRSYSYGDLIIVRIQLHYRTAFDFHPPRRRFVNSVAHPWHHLATPQDTLAHSFINGSQNWPLEKQDYHCYFD